MYAEDFPGNCFLGGSSGNYARKHNPFISYLNIQKTAERCSHIVGASEFDKDFSQNSLPEYVFYVPNVKNDGHDTGAAYADKWYEGKFSKLVQNESLMKDTVLITSFDESSFFSWKNQIYVSIVGKPVRPGNYSDALSTPSLLKLVEDNWNLGDLGRRDKTAAPIPNIWN